MDNFHEGSCLNCGATLQGDFCHQCGQKRINEGDRTVKHLLFQFFGAAFFLENNFLKNMWYLIARPGHLAHGYLIGQRKRYMPPFSLFFLINLIYFLVVPLSDLNLSLGEQVRQPHHGSFAEKMVNDRIALRGIEMEDYASMYNAQSSSLSKTLIVLHVPVMAFLLLLIFRKRDGYYADHMVFALYLIAFVLLFSMTLFGVLVLLVKMSMIPEDMVFRIYGTIQIVYILIYFFLATKRFYALKWYWGLAATPLVVIAFMISHMIYRTLLFLIVFWTT